MKIDDVTDEELTALLSTDQVAFTQQCFHTVDPSHKYIHNWHIECIVEHLQAMERGEIFRLIINMPPRSLKSITCTIAWTAWLLGHDPETQIIASSHSFDLSTKHNLDTKFVMESDWYRDCFPGTILTKATEKKLQTSRRGVRKVTSVNGAVMGEGGDYLIMDDPIEAKDAFSETVRTTTNRWVDQSFLTRENVPGYSRALVVMQRLHEKDTTAHLQAKGGWHELILPAYFEKKIIIDLGKNRWICNEGDFLHEERLGEDVLDKKVIDLTMQGFVGQYLMRPAALGGGEFKAKYIQYYNNYARDFTCEGMNIYILYDPANTKKKTSGHDPDYTAMVVIGLASDNNYYLLDLIRDRLNPTERVEKLFKLHMKWAKLSGQPPVVGVEHYGMMTEDFYIKKEMNRRNYRFRCIELKGAMKKEDRIRRVIPLFENFRVYFPRDITYIDTNGISADLVSIFIQEEILVFPVGKHDDILDAFARIVDNDLQAYFPEIGTVFLKAGQTLKDLYMGDFDESNYMTW